jgi:hypothetical protein
MPFLLAVAFYSPEPAPYQEQPQEARAVMGAAIRRIAESGQATVELNGEGTFGRELQSFRVVTAIAIDRSRGEDRPYLEQNAYVGGQLVSRIVGDGTTVWASWPKSRAYASASYGTSTGMQGLPALRRMMLIADRWTPADASFGIRLLAEAYTSGSAQAWSAWNSGGALHFDGRTVLSTSQNPAPASLSYRLGSDSQGYYLEAATFLRDEWNGQFHDRRSWTAGVWHGQVPTDFSAVFRPQAGDRAIAVGANRGG